MASNVRHYREVTLTDETSSTGITYVGVAKIPSGVTLTQAKAQAIWQVVKYVKTGTTTVITQQYYPLDSTVGYSDDRIFVWNNRATLTYDA